jgi:vesicle-associated membrane protein 4
MAAQDAPYDPYIPSGPGGAPQQQGGNARTQALQAVSFSSLDSDC